MKRRFIYVLAFFMLLVLVTRLTGGLKMFKIESTSNAPNLNIGDRIIGSRFVKPKPLDFAYFKFSDSLSGYTIMKRLIAVPFDTLECKKGNYYVNGKNVDEDLNLRFAYNVPKNLYNKYLKEKSDKDLEFYYTNDGKNMIMFLDNSFVKRLPIKLSRFENEKYYVSNLSKQIFINKLNWTSTDFGPIVLPSKSYFFSGDNRDNSFDSRYRGFVNEKHIIGSLIFQF